MERFFVYGYFNPDGEEAPFYIGKGCGNRHLQHWADIVAGKKIGNRFFYGALKRLHSAGQKPEIRILSDGLSEEGAYDLETSLIAKFGRRVDGSGCLCNIDPGFRNRIGFKGHRHTEETKAKLRRKRSETERARLRGPKSAAHQQKLKKNGNNIRVTWTLRTPSGEIIEVQNLNQFCRTNGLNPTPIYRSLERQVAVQRGKSSGWCALQRV